VVALLAALVAVVLTLRAAPSPVAVSAAPSFSGGALPGGGSSAAPSGASNRSSIAPSGDPSTAGSIVVDVAGKVRHPGVVSIPAGGRVADALRRAGGVLPGTDTSGLSQARKVTDGEQILVTGEPGPAPGPASAPAAGTTGPAGAGSTTGTGGATAPAAGDGTPGPGGALDLNAATQEQLEALPGVGPVLAGRIIAYRTEHNGFSSVDQLAEVKGLGGKTGQELMGLVRVG
jgi:competence protein ComEA